MKQTIEVILRMCPDSQRPISGDNTRPNWFNKEAAFKNLMNTKDEYTNVTVLFDGNYNGHWINNYPVTIIKSQGGDGDKSFASQIMYIKLKQFNDDTIIYILEDDYVHRENWPTILREGLSSSILPFFLKFNYITLYDHKDKYFYKEYNSLLSKIGVTDSVHWRTIPSTTNTFACLYKTFKEDFDVHYSFLNNDHQKFVELCNNGRLIGSSIPGYSTHCHKNYLSPCVNWNTNY